MIILIVWFVAWIFAGQPSIEPWGPWFVFTTFAALAVFWDAVTEIKLTSEVHHHHYSEAPDGEDPPA